LPDMGQLWQLAKAAPNEIEATHIILLRREEFDLSHPDEP